MTIEAKNPENWVCATLLDYFRVANNTTVAEMYSRAMVDMPEDVFQSVSKRVASFEVSKLGCYDLMNLGQFNELQKLVAAIIDGIYCTAAGLHSFDAALLDYLTVTAKPIFKWLREHGLAVHYLTNNTYSNLMFPADLFMRFFNAAGLLYACPQNAVWYAMQKHDEPWEMFEENYARNIYYSRHEYNVTSQMSFKKGISSVHLVMDGGISDFPELDKYSGQDGHVIVFRDQEPRPGSKYMTIPCRRPAEDFEM